MLTYELPCSLCTYRIWWIFAQIFVGGTRQCIQGYTRQSCLYCWVWAKHLSVGLFYHHNPELIFIISGVDGFFLVEREIIINYNTLPKSIDEQPHSIKSIGGNISGFEDPLHDEWIFTDRSDGWHQIAVSQFPLFDVPRLYFTLKYWIGFL